MAFRTAAVRDVGGYPQWDDYEEMGLLGRLLQAGWHLGHVEAVLGRHFVYRESFFERQHGYGSRRWRNLLRQLAMRREFDCIRVSRASMVGKFAYSFLPRGLKRTARKLLGYAR